MGFFIFYIGTCLGSFCHLVSQRLIKNEDWIYKRSYSECCEKELKMIYLLPIFSYLLLKGRCPYCHQKIAIKHLLVEIVCGCCVYLLYAYSQFFFIETLIMMVLWIISLMDFQLMEFNGELLLILGLLCSVYAFINKTMSVITPLLFLVLFKNKMGDGDKWILVMLSFCLSVNQLIIFLYISVFFGSLFSLNLVLFRKHSIKEAIPFCPFLCVGVFFAFMLG